VSLLAIQHLRERCLVKDHLVADSEDLIYTFIWNGRINQLARECGMIQLYQSQKQNVQEIIPEPTSYSIKILFYM
jgi:hypothetical protein